MSKTKAFKIIQKPNTGVLTVNGVKYIPEPEFVITKEQIIEVHKTAYPLVQKWIEEWFPEAFKKDKIELVVGKWYIDKFKRLFVPTEIIDKENCLGYGFGCIHDRFLNPKNSPWEINGSEREATTEEITEALTKEAVKRGFISGCFHTITNGSKGEIKKLPVENEARYGYSVADNKLLLNNWSIFENGKWAEIIPTITKEEAEKELGKKIVN